MIGHQNKIEQTQNESLNNINPREGNRVVIFLSFFFDLVKTFVIVMLVAFAIRYFVIQPFVVDGKSMLPAFVNNEYLIAEKISYDFKQPSRGDVVIFRYPKSPEIIYIKRVIGLPGELIEIKDGKVFVAASATAEPKELTESYLSNSTKTEIFNQIDDKNEFKILLKENEFFVLGDNRSHSSDSREWGILPKSNIIGRVWITVTPIERFKFYGQQKY